MSDGYGFTVEHDPQDDTWAVSLPHQCDRWDIGDDRWGAHADQVAALQRFITEAQQALGALRDRQEWPQ